LAFLPVILCFVVGLSVALAAIPRIQQRCLFGPGRDPSFHHTHANYVPRVGGLAFTVAFVAVGICAALVSPRAPGSLRLSLVFFVTPLAMFLVGFCDDLRALGATRKLGLQILIASSAFFFGVQIQCFQVPLTDHEIALGMFSGPITVFWLVAFTNLMNLIDGLDGWAAGVGLMLMSLLVVVGTHSGLAFSVLCATGLAGALLGFLRYNFPPAKIHMGDGGAYFIGCVIGLLTIINSQKGTVIAALITPAFAMALPIIDVSTAILRRGLRGLPIFRADKRHIHHKLLALGFSHRKTVLVLYIAFLVCLAFAFAVFTLEGVWLPIVFGAFFLTALTAARSVDFGRDWLAFGRVIRNLVDLRKDSRYALALVRWLELEAERAASVDELWSGFEFVCLKLRFTRATLSGAVEKNWRSAETASGQFFERSYELPLDVPTKIEFASSSSAASHRSFELLGELAAEAWFRAVQRWHCFHPSPRGAERTSPRLRAPVSGLADG
jgi:UDP-GlcNAc:undecaprenyl-phosphate/decaprenyl-phosphate GlcNAc-1-phosphate transferase